MARFYMGAGPTKKQQSYTIGPITARGRTKTDAKRAAEAYASAALNRLDEDSIIFVGPPLSNVTAVSVHPTLYSWAYTILWEGEVKKGSTCLGIPTKEDAFYAAVRHAAQSIDRDKMDAAHKAGSPYGDLYRPIERWLACLLDEGQAITELADLKQRWAWERRYLEYVARGSSHNEAHQLASKER